MVDMDKSYFSTGSIKEEIEKQKRNLTKIPIIETIPLELKVFSAFYLVKILVPKSMDDYVLIASSIGIESAKLYDPNTLTGKMIPIELSASFMVEKTNKTITTIYMKDSDFLDLQYPGTIEEIIKDNQFIISEEAEKNRQKNPDYISTRIKEYKTKAEINREKYPQIDSRQIWKKKR